MLMIQDFHDTKHATSLLELSGRVTQVPGLFCYLWFLKRQCTCILES